MPSENEAHTDDFEAPTLELTASDMENIRKREGIEKTIQFFIPRYDIIVVNKTEMVRGQYRDYLTLIREKLMKNNRIILGDLHASTLKLVETMILSGLATMPLEQARIFKSSYRTLVNKIDYYTSANEHGHVDFANRQAEQEIRFLYGRLLETIPFIEWTGGMRDLVLLGDVVGDRGLSDGVIMRIINQIISSAVRQGNPKAVTILFSNHDMSVLLDYFLSSQLSPELTSRMVVPQDADSYNRALVLEAEHLLEKLYIDHFDRTKATDFHQKEFSIHGAVNQRNLDDFLESIGLPAGSSAFKLFRKYPAWFNFRANLAYRKIWEGVKKQKKLDDFKQELLALAKLVWARNDQYDSLSAPFFPNSDVFIHGHHHYDDNIKQTLKGYRKNISTVIINADQICRRASIVKMWNQPLQNEKGETTGMLESEKGSLRQELDETNPSIIYVS